MKIYIFTTLVLLVMGVTNQLAGFVTRNRDKIEMTRGQNSYAAWAIFYLALLIWGMWIAINLPH